MITQVLTQAAAAAADAPVESGAELIAFWILAPLALLGAVGMVFSRVAVHSALWLVLTMLCLGCLYIAQDAEFLGFVQIIVYTGAIMMLFLFVLMLTGRDAGDSTFEVLKKQRIIATVIGIAFVTLLVTGLLRALQAVPFVGLTDAMAARGAIGSIAELLFTDYLFPFEVTGALLITAAVGAMVLAHRERTAPKPTQRDLAARRLASGQLAPDPAPGVYALHDAADRPALLPDGSTSELSVSPTLSPRDPGEEPRFVRPEETVAVTTESGEPAALPTTSSREADS